MPSFIYILADVSQLPFIFHCRNVIRAGRQLAASSGKTRRCSRWSRESSWLPPASLFFLPPPSTFPPCVRWVMGVLVLALDATQVGESPGSAYRIRLYFSTFSFSFFWPAAAASLENLAVNLNKIIWPAEGERERSGVRSDCGNHLIFSTFVFGYFRNWFQISRKRRTTVAQMITGQMGQLSWGEMGRRRRRVA